MRLRFYKFGVVYFALLVTALAQPRSFANRVAEPEWPEFTGNVKNYAALVDRLEKQLPRLHPKSSASQIAAHESALMQAIRAARPGAKQGNIFTPAVSQRLIAIVRSETRGPQGKPTRKAIQEDNPATGRTPVKVAADAEYPDGAPLSTVPPALLLRLPALPKNLDYRFVDHALILHDIRAGTIVDYIPNALP